MLTKPLPSMQVLLSLTAKKKLVLTLLVVSALAAIPLWLGLQRVHSAPPEVASSPPPPGPTPSVTLDVPDEVLIGEQFKFKVTFNPGTAVGYGPFIDLVLPAGGIDYNDVDPTTSSAGPCDGVTYVPGSAQMVGVSGGPTPVTTDVVSAPCTHTTAGACATLAHPYSANGISSVAFPNILVPEGAQLVTIKLPFGSFQPNQPPIVIQVTAKVSDHADVNALLHIYARAGFQFGSNALNDPNNDPPATLLSPGGVPSNCTTWTASAPVTPVLFTFRVEDRLAPIPGPCFDGIDNGQDGLTDSDDPDCKNGKAYRGPENETATGPNNPHKYKIILNIAKNMTVANLNVQDCLPNNMVLTNVVSTSTLPVPFSISPGPPLGPANSPNNCMTFNYPSITGGPFATDIVIEVEFYIPEKDANNALILKPNCQPVQSINKVNAEGYWTPVDPRDWGSSTPTPQHVVSNASLSGHVLADKCIAIQKSVTMFTDTGANGPTPGDTLMYKLNFQISDFKTVGRISISDYLSDGQQLVNTPSAPMLTVGDRFPNSTYTNVGFNAATLVVTPDQNFACPVPGGIKRGTKLVFDVSNALAAAATPTGDPRHQLGILTGGWASLPTSTTPATGQIVFYAKIQDQFAHPHPPGDQSVDKDDPITNCVQIAGTVYTNVNWPAKPASTFVGIGDGSTSATAIVTDTITKSVYAIKRGGAFVCGSTAPACPLPPVAPDVHPGDEVTFRIEKTIPAGDAEKMIIEDWLPLPILNIPGSFTNSACTGNGIPLPGASCRGPLDTLHTLVSSTTPTFIPHPLTNSIEFNYGNFNDPSNPPNPPAKADILFTSTVTYTPFADGLFLTNQAQECEFNTFGVRFCQSAIAQVNLREPNLQIRKGAIATDDPNGQFSQPGPPQTGNLAIAQPPAGVSFSLAGVAGVVSSPLSLFDSNLSNVDANDWVVFAVVIENQGGHPAYDVNLTDTVPSCFTNVTALKAQWGTGVPLPAASYTITPPTPSFTFTLNFPASIPANSSTANGANVIVITFRAQLLSNITPGCCDNVAELQHYASIHLGPDFVAAGFTPPFKDPARVCVLPKADKCVTTTSEQRTMPDNSNSGTPQVTIGEIIRYRLTMTLPEGVSPFLSLTDHLPAGLTYIGNPKVGFVSTGGAGTVSSTALSGSGLNLTALSVGCSGPTPTFGLPSTQVLGGPFGFGTDPTFFLGIVTNTHSDSNLEYVIVEFNALVNNIASNANNTTNPNNPPPLTNSYDVITGKHILGQPVTPIATSNNSDVFIVEPNLILTKTADPSNVMTGNVVSYTVNVTNNGTADAFDVLLTDPLPTGLTFVGGSIQVTSSCASPVVSGTTVIVPRIPVNCTVTVTFQAQVTAKCPTGIKNVVSADYSSLPGNGTALGPNNTTGSTTPGASGAIDGERNYHASAAAGVSVICPLGSLIVKKTITVPPPPPVWTPPTGALFPVSVTCLSSGPNATFNLTATSPTLTVPNIPVGSTCTVTEGPLPLPFGNPVCASLEWATPIYLPGQTVTIPTSGATTTVTILNKFFCDTHCATKPQNMVAWWPMDVQSNLVHDIATPGFDNVGSGPPYFPIPGEVGSALSFAVNHVVVPPHSELDFGTGDFSIDAWVRFPLTTPGIFLPIVDKFNPPGGPGFALNIRSQRLEFRINGNTLTSTGPLIAFNTWTHVAVTFRRLPVPQVSFYINGGPAGVLATPPTTTVNNLLPLWIGGTRVPGNFGRIEIDELELFKAVVPAVDIQRIFAAGPSGKCP